MNKHTRKKYPHARQEVTLWVDPPPEEIRPVSLFDETVRKLAKAEADLAEASKRIAALEKALANSRAVNAQAIKRAFADGPAARPVMAAAHARDLNSLTKAEEDELFRMHENESWIDPDAAPEPPPRPTLGKRIREAARLLTGHKEARVA